MNPQGENTSTVAQRRLSEYSAKPELHTCDCGMRATRWSHGWVCGRCYAIEQKMKWRESRQRAVNKSKKQFEGEILETFRVHLPTR